MDSKFNLSEILLILGANIQKSRKMCGYTISGLATSSGGLLLALIRAFYCSPRKHYYCFAYKAVPFESSFLDSSAYSFIYFCTASSVTLSTVST